MDRTSVHRRLDDAGLARPMVDALTNLLWNVHVGRRLREVDFARLSDAGFCHLDVCIIRELLDAALNRSRRAPPGDVGQDHVPDLMLSVLGTWDDPGAATRGPDQA